MVRFDNNGRVRSVDATFDPAKRDSANLLAGLGGAAVLGAALAPDDAQAKTGRTTRADSHTAGGHKVQPGKHPKARFLEAKDASSSTSLSMQGMISFAPLCPTSTVPLNRSTTNEGYYGLSAALGEMASGRGWMHRCTTVLASHGSRLNKLPMTSVGPRRTPLARRRSAPL